MMLSFSIPSMRVMIEAGLRERAVTGFPQQDASGRAASAASIRTKRQSIRRRGPVWQRVLAESEGGPEKGGRVERDLHLWWKSRTPEREKLGTVRGFEIFPVTIFHGAEDGMRPRETGFVRVALPPDRILFGYADFSDALSAASPDFGATSACAFAYADGFDEWLDFVNFFVPRPGDRFPGALIRW